MNVQWHPTGSGGMLHAIIRREGLPNRNSLCYLVCELPPYPRHVQDKLDKRKRVPKCSHCLRKMQARMQEQGIDGTTINLEKDVTNESDQVW